MFSQQSRFLIIANPLNEIEEAQMLRIEIPDSFRKKIKGDLNRFGINKMNLFRDLDSIASFIKWSHTDKY
jgi:hypothetical protein